MIKAEYIDHMGSDLTVVNAARVSFDKESDWDADGNLRQGDGKLISYLSDHNHWTPFSHVMITMRETVPIFIARERYRHTVGFTYNEQSRRYINTPPDFFVPAAWRAKPQDKKQGSTGYVDSEMATKAFVRYEKLLQEASDFYDWMIVNDFAPEQARIILPQSMYTSYYCTGSLSAWARAYNLRSQSDAQQEIQSLAEEWNKVISDIKGLEQSWNTLKQ